MSRVAYDAIAEPVLEHGRQMHGRLLRTKAALSSMACLVCGPLDPGDAVKAGPLGMAAMLHVKDNPGHRVAASAWTGAIYGEPVPAEEGEGEESC